MSQLLKDILDLLCFAVHGGGGHHALAASETRYSEVKPGDIPGTKCNGPAAVRQRFSSYSRLRGIY